MQNNPIVEAILAHLTPQINCVLIQSNSGNLFLVPEDEFYPTFLAKLYISFTKTFNDYCDIVLAGHKLFENSDYCASQLANSNRQIKQIYHQRVLAVIFLNIIKNVKDIKGISNLAQYVESKIPYTGSCYHNWLIKHHPNDYRITYYD
jgi:hypothetical protein